MIGANVSENHLQDRLCRAGRVVPRLVDVVFPCGDAAGRIRERGSWRPRCAGDPLGDVAECRGHRGDSAARDHRLPGTALAGRTARWPRDRQPARWVPWCGARRSGTCRDRPTEGRHLYVEGLLRRSRIVDRQALLPVQQSLWSRAAVAGRDDRRPAAGLGRVGLLRSRLPARGNRQPIQVHDGAGALRGTPGRGAPPRRADAAHLRDGAGRLERALRVAPRAELVRRAAVESVSDAALVAHR